MISCGGFNSIWIVLPAYHTADTYVATASQSGQVFVNVNADILQKREEKIK